MHLRYVMRTKISPLCLTLYINDIESIQFYTNIFWQRTSSIYTIVSLVGTKLSGKLHECYISRQSNEPWFTIGYVGIDYDITIIYYKKRMELITYHYMNPRLNEITSI